MLQSHGRGPLLLVRMWTLFFGQTGSSESLDCEEVAVEESKSERHVGGR